MISESEAMGALYARLLELTGAKAVLLGEPPSVQVTPLLYLLSNQTDYAPVTRTQYGATLQPRIRIVVAWQDAPNAETQLLALVDEVVALVTAPLDVACVCEVRQLLYGYLSVGGTRYRMAQLALHIEQDEL